MPRLRRTLCTAGPTVRRAPIRRHPTHNRACRALQAAERRGRQIPWWCGIPRCVRRRRKSCRVNCNGVVWVRSRYRGADRYLPQRSEERPAARGRPAGEVTMLGQSFAPLSDPNDRTQLPNGGRVNPVQEAIKTLSLELPRVLGAAAGAVAAVGRDGQRRRGWTQSDDRSAVGRGRWRRHQPAYGHAPASHGWREYAAPERAGDIDGEEQDGSGGGAGLIALPPGFGETPGGGFGTGPSSPQRPTRRSRRRVVHASRDWSPCRTNRRGRRSTSRRWGHPPRHAPPHRRRRAASTSRPWPRPRRRLPRPPAVGR